MSSTRRRGISISGAMYFVAFLAAIIVSTTPAFGQFIVQPMRIDVPAAPGQTVRTELQLQNHDPKEVVTGTISMIDLSQEGDGSWRIIEPDANDNTVDTSKLQTCRQWMKFSTESFQVKPLTIESVRLNLRVQAGVRGVYSAAILVRLNNPAADTQIGLTLQFVIPVLVHVQGRTPLRKVELTSLGMEYQQGTSDAPATTLVSMGVSNRGGTYSRLRGLIKLWGYFGDHWRLFAEREVQTDGILPGSDLKLVGDIGRSLPSGKYRITGALLVDGQRSSSVRKEMDFVGDPEITKIAADAALNVEPREIIINALPGSTRNSVIQVSNTSDEAVDIKVVMALPPVLTGVAFGPSYKGEDLSCINWLEIQPKTFKLPSYGQQNIQIIAKVPNPEMIHPCYYAILGLSATYPDGQDAGITTANICIVNQKCEGDDVQPKVRATGPISVALQKESEYIVSAVFGNYGKIHFTPVRCRSVVTNPNGTPMSQVRLDAEKQNLMLPFEFRQFSGLIDFSDYPAGLYRLEVSLEYGSNGRADARSGIEVILDGQQQVIKTLEQGELERRVGVQWK